MQPHHCCCSNIIAPAVTFWHLLLRIGTWSYIFRSYKLVESEKGSKSILLASGEAFLLPKNIHFRLIWIGPKIAWRLLALLRLLGTFLEPATRGSDTARSAVTSVSQCGDSSTVREHATKCSVSSQHLTQRLQYAVQSMQCALWSVQCVAYSVQYTMPSAHIDWCPFVQHLVAVAWPLL